jgi:hypothetical protein
MGVNPLVLEKVTNLYAKYLNLVDKNYRIPHTRTRREIDLAYKELIQTVFQEHRVAATIYRLFDLLELTSTNKLSGDELDKEIERLHNELEKMWPVTEARKILRSK